MPRAGRPFTTGLVTSLVSRGVGIAPITLHTGVASPEKDEPPYPERGAAGPATARRRRRRAPAHSPRAGVLAPGARAAAPRRGALGGPAAPGGRSARARQALLR